MSNLREYATQVEEVIAGIITGEGLSAGLLAMKQGPLTLTYKIRIYPGTNDPTTKTKPITLAAALRKALTLGPALSQALGVESVRVTEGTGALLIEVPSPIKRTPSAATLAEHTQGLRVCVGLDQYRNPVRVNLESHGAIYWIGPSRRGKTSSLKSSLYALAKGNGARSLRYVILSRKRGDWAAFEGSQGCMGVVSDPGEAMQVLEWAARDLLQLRGETGAKTPAVIIVADDLLNLLGAAEAGMADSLAEIASQGAGLGVHLLAGTQDAGSKASSGGQAVEANVTCRIIYRAATATGAARAAGQGNTGLEDLSSAKGDALLFADGQSVRIATGLPDDKAIAALPKALGLMAPWKLADLPEAGGATGATSRNRAQPATTGRNQPQPATTTHNRLTAPPFDFVKTLCVDIDGEGEAGAVAGGCEAEGVVVPVVDDPVAVALDQEAASLFPVERRPLDQAEVAVVVALNAGGVSKNKIIETVYGHKDGKTNAWINQALLGEWVEKKSDIFANYPEEEQVVLDMSSPDGVAFWNELIDKNLVKVPKLDPKDFYTQEAR